MGGDATDETALLELLDGGTGKRAVDAHAVNKVGGGDEAGGGDLLHDLIEGGLVEDDGVVGLVLDLSLGPLLLGFLTDGGLCGCLWYMRWTVSNDECFPGRRREGRQE